MNHHTYGCAEALVSPLSGPYYSKLNFWACHTYTSHYKINRQNSISYLLFLFNLSTSNVFII